MDKPALLFVLLAGVLWGCIGLFVRPLKSSGLNSMEIVAIRAYVTLATMLIFILIYDWRLLKIKLRDIWCFIGTGICSIVFFNYCYFTCITLTSLSVAAILLYTAPTIVMVLSFFLFKEKFTVKMALALILTFIGCMLVAGVGGLCQALSLHGILVGLGAGLGYALYSIFGRYAIDRGYNSLTITFYTFLIASTGCFFIADNKQILSVMTSEVRTGILCIGFGIVCTVLPYLSYTIGLKKIDNGKATIIASVEPVTATILGILIYHEKCTFGQTAGVIIVIAALALCNANS